MAIIDKPSDYFNTKLYTGNSSTQSITGVGFQPDWTWIKGRSGTYGVSNHKVYDVVRGATKTLFTNLTNAESTQTNTLTSFDSDGFSLGNDTNVNASSTTYASWSWLAGGTASSNTDGSITSSVSANQDAGFSIVTCTTQSSGTGTVGHGLGVAPSLIIQKIRTLSADWYVYNASIGAGNILKLNTTDASTAVSSIWNSTAPTSSFFTLGDGWAGSYSTVAYCFAEKQGYSKFGSYTGNGSTDGTFVYTGFKPAFVMLKSSSSGSVGWITHDNKRIGFNPNNYYVEPNNSNAESADTDKILLLSNGFKLTSTSASWNASGGTYIYMCFAENPFVTSTGVPATAR